MKYTSAMSSSTPTINTRITCGNQELHTNAFNDQTDMDVIDRYIQSRFDSLPKPYQIKFYNAEIKDFTNLSQNELQFGYNPFRLNSSINDQNTENMSYIVQLY